MIINNTSVLRDILQACNGTWQFSEENGWKCIEMGNMRMFRKTCTKGSNVLPKTFLEKRKSVVPVTMYTKYGIKGQCLDLQQNAINVEENCIVDIVDF